jgi:hypothetical protein
VALAPILELQKGMEGKEQLLMSMQDSRIYPNQFIMKPRKHMIMALMVISLKILVG